MKKISTLTFFTVVVLVGVFVFSMTACGGGGGGGDDGGWVAEYAVGDTGPGGGKIYYVSTTGFTVQMINPAQNYTAHYLEAAPTNAHTSAEQWADYGTTVTGITTNTSSNSISADNHDGNIPFIGQGRKDTMLIVAHMEGKGITYATAQYAIAYRGPNNLTDWYLPSLSELSLYYWSSVTEQKPTSKWFWSSSQYDSSDAWGVDFNSGDRGRDYKIDGNDVRPIRAF